jgi:hypothetical protein
MILGRAGSPLVLDVEGTPSRGLSIGSRTVPYGGTRTRTRTRTRVYQAEKLVRSAVIFFFNETPTPFHTYT